MKRTLPKHDASHVELLQQPRTVGSRASFTEAGAQQDRSQPPASVDMTTAHSKRDVPSPLLLMLFPGMSDP